MRFDTRMTEIPTSTMLSCEKDLETILRKLFIEARPYSDILKRLLVIQSPDCLDKEYDVSEWSLKRLLDEQYVSLIPVIKEDEFEKLKSYIIIEFLSITPGVKNPEFSDKFINISIACHHDAWMLTNYRQRVFKIAGYIDGILNKSRLSGIGQLESKGGSISHSTEHWSVWTLTYLTKNGDDDKLSASTEQ